MLSIPTAEEARKRVEELESEGARKMAEKVAEAIEEAINNLECSCTIDGHLPEALERDLVEKKHYKVKLGNQKNEAYTTISW